MKYTNEILKKMEIKQKISKTFSDYYYHWSQDMTLSDNRRQQLDRKNKRMHQCCSLWEWDMYQHNKILDLKKVNRCKNNKFCPNCKKYDIAKTIRHFSPIFEKLINEGYKPYLMTLTVPNCKGKDLEETINKMNKAFRKFNHLYSMSIDNKKSFKDRSFSIDGALKVLEVTYNKKTREYHPHFHCLVFTKDEIIEDDLMKTRYTGLKDKAGKDLYKSFLDLEIATIWTMCYNDIRISDKNYNNMGTKFGKDIYMTDIRVMDKNGIYEVLKYTLKDTDIINFNVFKTLNIALEGKRIRQGYGILYNVKFENVETGEAQALELAIEEKAFPLVTTEIKVLYTEYGEYQKISRFNNINDVLEKVDQYNTG